MNKDGDDDAESLRFEIEYERQLRRDAGVTYYEKRGDKVFKVKPLNKLQMFEEIAGRPRPKECEVCNRGGKIVFDHCHGSGKFRGWICMGCNTALGMVNDDIDTLLALASYLKFHQSD